MELDEIIKLRRSIRKFKPDAVSDEDIKKLLEAARLAPSGSNLQPWRYVVVKSSEVREKLSKHTPLSFVTEAPVIIVCCVDTKAAEERGIRSKELSDAGAFSGTELENITPEQYAKRPANTDEFAVRANLVMNTAIGVEHIALKAVDLGLGTCWIGMFDKDGVKNTLKLDDKYNVVALMPVGYPDQEPSQRPRLPLEEIILKEM